MPIDPNIALNIRTPEFESPLNSFAKVMAIQHAQNQNELAKYSLAQSQRTDAQANAMNEAYSKYPNFLDDPEQAKGLISHLASRGAGSGIPIVQKGIYDRQKEQTEIDQKKAQTLETNNKIATEAFRNMVADPSPENVRDTYVRLVKQKVIPPEQAQAELNTVGPMAPAERVAYWVKKGLPAKDLAEYLQSKPVKKDDGKIEWTEEGNVNLPTFGQRLTAVPLVEKKATPSAELASETQKATNAATNARIASEGAANRGQALELYNRTEKTKADALGVDLAPRDRQGREKAYPKATAAVGAFEAEADNLTKDMAALRDHPGLSQISGILAGRMIGITQEGRAAKALYDKIIAKGGFQSLQNIRTSSPSGGGLGSVSNTEGAQLKAAFGALDRTQDAADIQKALNQAIEETQASKQRIREAYDTTYEYRKIAPATAAPAGKTTPIAPGTVLRFDAQGNPLP